MITEELFAKIDILESKLVNSRELLKECLETLSTLQKDINRAHCNVCTGYFCLTCMYNISEDLIQKLEKELNENQNT